MTDILTIAQNTFGKLAREKTLYALLLGCLVIVWAMGLYGPLSVGREDIMMIDAALALALIVGLLSAMSAAFEIPRELKGQTAQLVLSKPMGRSEFIIGKWLGLSIFAAFNVAILTLGSAIIIGTQYEIVDQAFYWSAVLVGAEAITLVGVGILLSTFSSEAGAAIGIFLVFAIGHGVYMLPRIFEGGILHQISVGISNILPNFYHTDFKPLVSAGIDFGREVALYGGLYGILYALFLVSIAVLVFEKRDIT